LRGKKVILDFWAVWCGPCLSELGPLQEFQQKHPEIEVLTIVSTEADAKQLGAVIRDKKLTILQIAEAPQELWERFGVYGTGVPQTLIIDQNGFVRIQHAGALPNVSRYLTADLTAVDDAGPVKQADRGTDQK
jgi:thiol-disulfide isomerase/thioredoxin